jgi:hypothetical protein
MRALRAERSVKFVAPGAEFGKTRVSEFSNQIVAPSTFAGDCPTAQRPPNDKHEQSTTQAAIFVI